MKPKQLVPLVVILAVLAGLVFLRQTQNRPASLEQQYTLHALLPEAIDAAKLARIEMYAGAKPDEKLVLEREVNGTKWSIASKFGAPVDPEKIDDYLQVLKSLQGEFRAEAAGDSLKDYSLDEEGGFHVLGYNSDSEEPQFHIVNGKSPDFQKAFARAAGGSDVYEIDVSLRRKAGIYTVEMGDTPQATHWLDKTVLDLESDKIKAVALEYPDKTVAFELQKKVAPDGQNAESASEEGAGDPEAAPEGESNEAAQDEGPKEEIVEWNWVVTQGGPGTEFHSNAASNLARRAAQVRATDVVDPAEKAALGLDPPQYRATLTVEGQETPVVLEAGRPAGDTYAYMQIAGADRDIVYKVSGYDFEQIFQKGGEFFELPGVLVEAKDVNKIEYTLGDRKAALEQRDGAWKATAPVTDVPADQAALDRLARTLLAWKADDYADSAEGKGFDAATDEVTFSGAGVSHAIALGAEAPGQGRYARLDAGKEVLVMSESDVAAIFQPYAGLFQPAVFDVDEAAIETIAVAKGDSSFRLERAGEDVWNLVVGDAPEEADTGKVSDLLFALVDLEADDLEFRKTRTPGDVFGSVSFTIEDGAEFKMTVERSTEGEFSVTKPGVNAVYRVPATSMARIFAEPDELRPAPPAAPEEAPAAEEPEPSGAEEPESESPQAPPE
jgi:hypothetical protein